MSLLSTVAAPPRTQPSHLRRSSPARLAHIPALDGLRGVAVAGVLLFHAGHLRGGFLGVDLFFVLSGFLITSLLLLEHDSTGGISLGRFWSRRFRRLLPAVLVVLAAVAVYGWWSLAPTELPALRRDGLGTLGYVANWVAIGAGGDYWAAYQSPSLLEHTWSLAIEEQFYLLWPLVVAFLLAGTRSVRTRRARLLVATSVLALVSIARLLVTYQTGGDTSRAYYGTDTRIAAILYGALLAGLVTGRERRAGGAAERLLGAVLGPLAAVGLAVGWAVTNGTSAWLYRWGLPVFGVAAAVVIAAASGPHAGRLGRLLALRPLRRLGVVSYGLYLWHWPIFVVVDSDLTGLSGWPLTIVRVALSLAVAEVSLRVIEQPVRFGRVFTRTWRFAAPGAMALVGVVLAASTLGGVARPAPGFGEVASVVPADGPGVRATLAMFGDSGAALLGPGLQAAGAERGIEVSNHGTVGCGLARAGEGVTAPDGSFLPDPPDCHSWPDRWTSILAAEDPDAAVLFLAWGGIGDRQLPGGAAHPCDPAFDHYYRGEVDAALDILTAGRPAFVATVPYNPLLPEADERVRCLNRIYAASVAHHPGAELVDLGAWTCPQGACREQVAGAELRPDGVHFEGPGAEQAGRWLLDRMEERGLGGALPTRVLLVGDSQAFRLAMAFAASGIDDIHLWGSARWGCGTSPGLSVDGSRRYVESECDDLFQVWREAAAEADPEVVVLLSGAWEVMDREVDGRLIRFGTPEWDELTRQGLSRAMEALAAPSRRLAVLTAPCFRAEAGGRYPAADRNDPARVQRYNEILREVAASEGAEVLDYFALLCPEGSFQAGFRQIAVARDDGVHLNESGGVEVWGWLRPQLVRPEKAPAPAAAPGV